MRARRAPGDWPGALTLLAQRQIMPSQGEGPTATVYRACVNARGRRRVLIRCGSGARALVYCGTPWRIRERRPP